MWTSGPTDMDRMTAGQMLGRVDALLPNQYGREEKMQWLAQAEGFVLREAEQATGALPEVTEEYALTAGDNRISGICITDGDNVLTFTGNGTVSIDYRGGRL